MTFTYFDDIERQMVDMLRAFDYPSFGRIEPPTTAEAPSGSRDVAAASRRGYYPFMRAKMDLVETPKAYKVLVELPGVKKEDVKVSVDEGVLTVQAEQNETINREEDKYHYSERRYGTIKRSVSLPQGISPDNVKASFNNGLLELEFAKSEKEAAKLISIGWYLN